MAVAEAPTVTPEAVKAKCEAFRTTYKRLRDEIGKVMVGHTDVIDATLIGLFVMVSRRQALMQIVGLVLVENAIFLAAVSLTYGMPLVVEIGVLLDVLVGVALLGLWIGRIEQTFESGDTSRMSSLKG